MSLDWEQWRKTGRLLVVIDDEATARAGNHASHHLKTVRGELLKQHGVHDIDKGVRSRLIAIMRREADVETWRRVLTAGERLKWNHPYSVHHHCPLFKKTPDPNVKPKEKPPTLREVNARLQEELHRVQEEKELTGSGSNVDFDNYDAPSMAATIARGLVTAAKIRRLIHALGKEAKRLEEVEAKAPAVKRGAWK